MADRPDEEVPRDLASMKFLSAGKDFRRKANPRDVGLPMQADSGGSHILRSRQAAKSRSASGTYMNCCPTDRTCNGA